MNTNKLPDTVTSDVQLNKHGQKYIPGFKGVISRDEFSDIYNDMMPGDSVIINLDPEYSRGGTHWVAFRMSSEAPVTYYKDSFGAPPPEDVIAAVKASDLGLVYGNRIVQDIKMENCGKLSMKFLEQMAKGARQKREIETFIGLEM